MKKLKLGLYPGSFDPFHIGHLDIVNQAIQVFDEVLVSKGVNPDKHPNDRYSLPFNTLSKLGVKWDEYDTLLTDHIKWPLLHTFLSCCCCLLYRVCQQQQERNLIKRFTFSKHQSIAQEIYWDPRSYF